MSRRARCAHEIPERLLREQRAVDQAWRIHAAQLEWTARADAKAAFAFGVDSAVITTVGVLLSTGRVFVHFDHWYLVATSLMGALLLLAAIVFSSVGVAPRLRRRQARSLWPDNFIYFGHARHWDPEDLARALERRPLLAQLARQIQVTANVAWKKHMAVNWAIWLTLGAGVILTLYVALTRL